MSKYLSLYNLLISKKTGALAGALQKIDFLWGFRGESLQKIAGDKIAFAAQQLYAKIRFRCFVVYKKKSVQDLGRKKRKKPHGGQKLIGRDETVF